MFTQDDFNYAMEHTRVIRPPEGQIETFGSTRFRFYLLTELMDSVNQIRIRDGHIEAGRPQIVKPEHLSGLMLEGFGEKAREYAEWLGRNARDLNIVKYGFQFTRSDLSESVVHDSVDQVADRLATEVEDSGDPLRAVIQGVDDAWEVCLLKFTIDLIQKSSGQNFDDLRGRGLL